MAGWGCSQQHAVKVVPAGGVVTFEGRPLEGAQVTFLPAYGRPASASTDSEGRFQLTTFTAQDGAGIGRHRVTISKRVFDPKITYDKGKSLIPAGYETPASSKLEVDVTAEGPNDFNFALQRNGP